MGKHKTIFFLLFFIFPAFSSTITFASDYRIENVKGNVYRFVADRHRSVFLVTPEGVLMTDPLNESAARWLKAEFTKRFNVPVKFVVYSHNHSDHIYETEVLKTPETTVVSHELAKQDIQLTKAATIIPEVTFKQKMAISLGDSIVELQYHGPNDGRGSISMLFYPEKVLYVVDWIVVGRMPWQNSGAMTLWA